MRIESGGTNYSEYDTGDYLRIFLNDVSVSSTVFTRGITIVVMDSTTFNIDSTKTYDSGNTSFDPTTMITDINAIAAGKYVLVGIRDNASYNLSTNVYTAL